MTVYLHNFTHMIQASTNTRRAGVEGRRHNKTKNMNIKIQTETYFTKAV